MTEEKQYDDFFEGQGEKVASFKFQGIGDVVVGTILDQFKTQQTKFGTGDKLFFDDGTPRMQLNVTLQTDLRNWDKVTKPLEDENDKPLPASEDDGKRRIFIKSDMQSAIGKAIKAAGAPGLRNGGKLAVKMTGTKDVGKGNPMSLYEARYQPPAEGDGFFDAGAAQQPPAQQAPAQQQAAAPPQQAAPATRSDDPWATAPVAASSSFSDEPPF